MRFVSICQQRVCISALLLAYVHPAVKISAGRCVFVCVCGRGRRWCSVCCRSKKMCCSVSVAVNVAPTCCSCVLRQCSSLIKIRKLSLNSLALWLVWRAKICIQNKALALQEWHYYTWRCKENNVWVRIEHCQFNSVLTIRWTSHRILHEMFSPWS